MTSDLPIPMSRASRIRRRQVGRWLVLAIAVFLAWPWGREHGTAVLLPSLSPFVGVCSDLALRSLPTLSLVCLPVLGLSLMSRRWFCRHACPTGLLQEIAAHLRPSGTPIRATTPIRPGPTSRVPVGTWLALMTLGGAAVGYPLFLWLDPLAIFHGFLNALRPPLAVPALLTGLGLPLLLVLSVTRPGVWCQRLCPLGATQELLALPRFWRHRTPGLRPDQNHDSSPSRSPGQGRRHFLGACAGAAGALAIQTVRGQSVAPLRPPGAALESQFTGLCLRCGNCARSCPSHVIQADLGDGGLTGLFAPVLRFTDDYCRENCHRCTQVCPSGAIGRVSLPEKRRWTLGQAKLDLDSCLLANGRECTACIQHCPFQAVALRSTDGGFSTIPSLDLAKCTGCGACEAFCPVRPRRAIRVIAQPSGALKERQK